VSDSTSNAFHHAVVKIGGRETLLSKSQYDAMPLRDRVKLILEGGVTFYDSADQVLPANLALMRQRS
jgi:hypothetical protein